jgi:serine/threonine protein kinase
MEGKFSFTSTEWRDVTTAPKDLISRILVVDYRQRPTVQQCLSHEFFRESRRDSMSEVAEPFQSRRLFRRVGRHTVLKDFDKNIGHENIKQVREN